MNDAAINILVGVFNKYTQFLWSLFLDFLHFFEN